MKPLRSYSRKPLSYRVQLDQYECDIARINDNDKKLQKDFEEMMKKFEFQISLMKSNQKNVDTSYWDRIFSNVNDDSEYSHYESLEAKDPNN